MGDESPHEVDTPLSSSRVNSHREKCPGSLCSYIRLASFRGTWTDEVQFLFHDPCDTCSSFSEREPLCNFCNRLRLRHLLVCLWDELRGLQISLGHYYNDRDAVSRVITTKGCAFCALIAKAIRSYLEISGRNKEAKRPQTSSLELNLGHLGHMEKTLLLRLHPPGGESEEIKLHYIRRPTPSIPTSPKNIIPKLVDWDRVQGWLSYCNQKHDCKRSEHSTMPEGFRLIDMENRCVTSEFGQDAKLGVDIKFVAFSYVWGGSSVSRDDALLNSNKSEFEAAGGLKKEKIPQAIEDAITICKRLKQRYLWVDRFCIIQNNEDGGEKQRQIDAMGDIYSSAEFTIIHASGESVHCPIPGVSKERKVFQSRSVIAGLEFTMTHPDLGVLLKNSKWVTRGWTYQEAILSPRKLVFTPFEVWFECHDLDDPYQREDQYSTRRENRHFHYTQRAAQFQMNHSSVWGTLDFTNFVRHLQSYTARSLTNQSDILNAFTGILASVYEGERSFHGLPEADFDQALLWYCTNDYSPTRRGEDCPSWSWTSVSERVTAPVNESISGFIGTLVWWVYRDPHTGLTDLRPRNSLQPEGNRGDRSRIHLLFAWWKGCIEAPIPDDLEQQLEIWSKDDLSVIASRWSTLEKIWDDIRSARDAGPKAPRNPLIGLVEEDHQLIDKLPSRALLTRAQTALFKVSRGQGKRRYCDLSIVDANGKHVGVIEGQDESAKGAQDPCEFMALSLSQNDLGLRDLGSPGREPFSFRNIQPVVNVLLIGRTKESWLAHRISVGRIFLADWCKAPREFKTIALE